MIKRDYELTQEELERRNNKRESRKGRKAKSKRKVHSVLVWYDGTLEHLTESEYNKIYNRELKRHNNIPCLKWECRNGNCLTCKYKDCGRECQFFNCLGCKYVSECVGEIIKVQ